MNSRIANRRSLQSELPKRFVARLDLLWRWMTRVVLPGWWKPLFAASILKTIGALAEAASFLVAAQLLIDWASIEAAVPSIIHHPLVIGGALLIGLLLFGALCAYLSDRIAVRMSLDFETTAFAAAPGILKFRPLSSLVLTDQQVKDFYMSAPRTMARTLMQTVGAGSSSVLIVTGAFVCAGTYPALTGILAVLLVVTAPIYVLHARHSTRVGHRFREAGRAHSAAKKDLMGGWMAGDAADVAGHKAEAIASPGYSVMMDAYGERLTISPISHLIVNALLGVSILVSLIWIGLNVRIDTDSIGRLIVYLVFLRVFFTGLRSVMSASQIVASFVPNFLLYLLLDPRMEGRPLPTQTGAPSTAARSPVSGTQARGMGDEEDENNY